MGLQIPGVLLTSCIRSACSRSIPVAEVLGVPDAARIPWALRCHTAGLSAGIALGHQTGNRRRSDTQKARSRWRGAGGSRRRATGRRRPVELGRGPCASRELRVLGGGESNGICDLAAGRRRRADCTVVRTPSQPSGVEHSRPYGSTRFSMRSARGHRQRRQVDGSSDTPSRCDFNFVQLGVRPGTGASGSSSLQTGSSQYRVFSSSRSDGGDPPFARPP